MFSLLETKKANARSAQNLFSTLRLKVKSKVSTDLSKLGFDDYGFKNSTNH